MIGKPDEDLKASAEYSSAAAALQPVLRREGTQHVPFPEGCGKLLEATVFHGLLLISCEAGLYVRSAALQVWEKIELKGGA